MNKTNSLHSTCERFLCSQHRPAFREWGDLFLGSLSLLCTVRLMGRVGCSRGGVAAECVKAERVLLNVAGRLPQRVGVRGSVNVAEGMEQARVCLLQAVVKAVQQRSDEL